MKKMKKLLSLLLAAMFLFGVIAPAYAEETPGELTVNMTQKDGNFSYDGKYLTDGGTIYHQFTLKKPTLVKLTGKTYYSSGELADTTLYGTISVTDANLKEVLSISSFYTPATGDPYACFFLKKGTYNLKLQTSYPYKLKLKCKTYSRKVAKKKNKAVNIAKNKAQNGYFLPGEKNDHWYKIKLTKKQRMKFKFTANGSGTINFTLYSAKKGSVSGYAYNSTYSNEFVLIPGNKPLPKGTYHVKVSRSYNNISGQYSIRWK